MRACRRHRRLLDFGLEYKWRSRDKQQAWRAGQAGRDPKGRGPDKKAANLWEDPTGPSDRVLKLGRRGGWGGVEPGRPVLSLLHAGRSSHTREYDLKSWGSKRAQGSGGRSGRLPSRAWPNIWGDGEWRMAAEDKRKRVGEIRGWQSIEAPKWTWRWWGWMHANGSVQVQYQKSLDSSDKGPSMTLGSCTVPAASEENSPPDKRQGFFLTFFDRIPCVTRGPPLRVDVDPGRRRPVSFPRRGISGSVPPSHSIIHSSSACCSRHTRWAVYPAPAHVRTGNRIVQYEGRIRSMLGRSRSRVDRRLVFGMRCISGNVNDRGGRT